MIELQQVSKTYSAKSGQVIALHDISLNVKPGEIFGVIGKSGAGKSTLLRCVNLLERPTRGRVYVNERELMQLNPKALRQARREIGMVFQHFNLLNTRTVYENIAFPLQLQGFKRLQIDEAVRPLLALTGLSDREKAYPNQLSGGQKQRVAIARALATKPRVLLCDEMTSALDPQTTESILALVKTINEELNLSILLITHEMDVIKKIADTVAVMDEGRIIEMTDVVSIFKHPKTTIAKAFTQSTMHLALPKVIADKLRSRASASDQAILEIVFTGRAAAEPVIEHLVRHYNIDISILLANLEFLRHETIGKMVVAARGAHEELTKALADLQQKGVEVEVLGYVGADDHIIN